MDSLLQILGLDSDKNYSLSVVLERILVHDCPETALHCTELLVQLIGEKNVPWREMWDYLRQEDSSYITWNDYERITSPSLLLNQLHYTGNDFTDHVRDRASKVETMWTRTDLDPVAIPQRLPVKDMMLTIHHLSGVTAAHHLSSVMLNDVNDTRSHIVRCVGFLNPPHEVLADKHTDIQELLSWSMIRNVMYNTPQEDDEVKVEDDWFLTYCQSCKSTIPCRNSALRLPMEGGGWMGCFCGYRCLANASNSKQLICVSLMQCFDRCCFDWTTIVSNTREDVQ